MEQVNETSFGRKFAGFIPSFDEGSEFGNTTTHASNSTTTMFYALLSTTGVVIAVPNGIIVALAIGILRTKSVNGVHKAQYCYIASLAGSDFMVGLVIFVIHLWQVKTEMFICTLKISFAVTSGIASILHTLLVAADRYFYIMHGMMYLREMRRSRVFLATAAAWLTAIIVGFAPVFFPYISQRQMQFTRRCFYVEVVPSAYIVLLNAMYVFLGLVPTTILYFKIVRTALSQQAAVDASSSVTQSSLTLNEIHVKRRLTPTNLLRRPSQLFRSERRAVTAILLLVISFAVCWIPHSAASLVYAFRMCGEDCKDLAKNITTVFYLMGTLNSLLNPIIYVWGFKEFRSYVRKIFNAQSASRNDSLI